MNLNILNIFEAPVALKVQKPGLQGTLDQSFGALPQRMLFLLLGLSLVINMHQADTVLPWCIPHCLSGSWQSSVSILISPSFL